ncbi:MAG TPA: N-acetylglucosamine-6-phosphate deacetylase [Bryobacteraceae bacterium]|nr:N-acetylglucosamine-6-phosphate deacetylase [Bryobacteraceae bacterium]
MKCYGRYVSTGEVILVEGSSSLQYVDAVVAPDPDDGGVWLAPGFIDLQVNGFAGVDFNSLHASHEEVAGAEIARALRAMFSTGVTRCFPTLITAAPEHLLAALRNLARARDTVPEGAAIEGFHMEGPHISPEDGPRGAHPQRWVRPPDFAEFQRWQEASRGAIRLVTVAPEWPGMPRYIERVVSEGTAVAIGHTRATREQIQDAVGAGATLSTHLGNGADPAPPKFNYIFDQLAEDRLAASFIVDGHHLSASFLRAALRAKGVDRSILITDAVAPAMSLPGPYRLGEVEVELREDRRVVLKGGDRLAGSSLRMDAAISKVMRTAGLSLTEACAMATINPARVGRIAGRQRGLRPGERSDLVRFRVAEDDLPGKPGRLQVIETYLNGERVFAASL